MTSIRAAACLLFAVLVSHMNVLPARTVSVENIVDLTHTLTPDFPFIPISSITFRFNSTPIATIAQMGVAADKWDIHEHIGTQIDASARRR